METTQLIYAVTGALIIGLGLSAALRDEPLLARIIAINIAGVGVFLLFVAIAYRGFGQTADPIPHALVLTGIVVAVAASGLAIAINRRLHHDSPSGDGPAEDSSA
ncbi:NADH-quinone oxidoreductase subunit K [Motiliproteus sediminis]|uniref:NADH-quinone oxidoreductase subunit K n=1 Tax=Motiliproteus sediminis TaxID=1468178 RepID=UPI001AEFCA0C|nr:NADH-quinone oxidoreductase subunit K [Motiliproteus sediminis]